MMATGTVTGTGITPTLITATCLSLPTASGGDSLPVGLLPLRRLRLLSLGFLRLSLAGYNDYPYDSYDYNTQDPYSYYSGYAAPAQSGNAVVSSVQSQLAKLGYCRGADDGVAGDETQAAVARYQQDNDLSVTGTVYAGHASIARILAGR